ncbi:ProQ/FINO family protein, partial [Klebsiella pneumoniae]|uniref:ProQ/FINO family protein n=1 Tax=Klebsiella pneumoniae TaxID=573 RepID=UPI001E3D6E08
GPQSIHILRGVRQQQDEPGRFSICSRQAAVVQVMTFRWQYLQNCTVPGATRYDLYGKPAGTVKKAHATYAQLVLDARKKASEKKQLKRKG